MRNNLRISNMIFTGRMWDGVKLKEEEIKRLIRKGELNWMIINEDISPILSAYIERPKKEIGNHGQRKCFYVSIWTSGAINIVGVRSRKEANYVYNLVMKDIKKFCRRVLSSQSLKTTEGENEHPA